jgi:hypothetical protein
MGVLQTYFMFGNYVDSIYTPIELVIKDITNTARSTSYFDIHLEIDSKGRLRKKLRPETYFQFS